MAPALAHRGGGTTVMEGQPERSFAMIENKNTGHTGPYSIVKGKNGGGQGGLGGDSELEVLINEGVIQRCGGGHKFTAPKMTQANQNQPPSRQL